MHYGYPIPSFLGKLPGDIVLMKDKNLIQVPVASSMLIGAIVSLITTMLMPARR